MEPAMNMSVLQESANIVRQAIPQARPACAVILGSGWGDVAAAFKMQHSVSYEALPCMGQTQVQGHSGCLLLVESSNVEVLIFQGRHHWYEGLGWDPISFPVYLCISLEIPALILTNAAASLRDSLEPGDLMVIDDHINAMGTNPLIGAHDPIWGPRFPSQTEVYNLELRRLADRAANKMGYKIPHGIYLATSGPAYETPAEVEAFRRMGANAIGMSTVPEAILANAAGLAVMGISCITNRAAARSETQITHEEVLVQAARTQPRMKAFLTNLFADTAFQMACRE